MYVCMYVELARDDVDGRTERVEASYRNTSENLEEYKTVMETLTAAETRKLVPIS